MKKALSITLNLGCLLLLGLIAEIPCSEASPANTDWQARWEKTLNEARKEGKVVVYSSYPASVRTDIGKAFKGKFGVDIEFVSGRGGQLRTKLDKERKAGLYICDLLLKGVAGQDFRMIQEGTLDPLKPLLMLPEVLNTELWWKGRVPWIDDAGEYILGFGASQGVGIAINTSAVNPDEIKSWYDFLDPRWKGKIMFSDPTASGAGQIMFSVMGNHILGFDYFHKLAKQEPVLLRDQRLMAEWLARGKYPILIGIAPYALADFIKAGSPIAQKILQEGGYVSIGSSAVFHVNRAPHPAAAAIFVNWLLGPEGGTLVSKGTRTQSARVDVPTGHLTPGEIMQPGIKYFDARSQKVQTEQIKAAQTAKEIFGPLLK